MLGALAGCGSGDNTATQTSPIPETTPAAAKPEKLVVVHETEFKLNPANATGGDEGLVKIKVVNDGKIPHALAVDGPNGEVDLDGQVDPGKSATFEADLDKPGTYTWYCPLGDHRARGMSGTITVGGSTPARGAEPTTTTTTSSTSTTPTQTTTQTQTETQTQTQTETKTVTTPTDTDTTPTATTGDGY